MNRISILLVEDHQLVREALQSLIERDKGLVVAGQAQDGSEALAMVEQLRPQVVVMDIMMPNLNGFKATARMRTMRSAPYVIILSQHRSEQYVVEALMAGAHGYLLKDAAVEELLTAIRAVVSGEKYLSAELDRDIIDERLRLRQGIHSDLERLTQREREVLQLVAEGKTNRQIALHLKISVKTVEKHRFSLMEKLNIRDTAALVRFAISHHVIASDP